ncbi:DMT family transporter [Mariniluteicoccus endophyticus]
MHWTALILSALFEAVWATALAASNGLRRPVPTLVFLAAQVVSMAGLAYAMTAIPAGTAYAVWVGIGAVATLAVQVARGAERLTALRAGLILGLVACVAGLKVVA